MAEIVNLRRVRKARAKEAAAVQAAERRAVHGQTRAEREAALTQKRHEDRVLDGALLDRDRETGE